MAQAVLFGSQDNVPPAVVLCDVHTSEDITQFCGECSTLICDQCLTGTHKSHSGKKKIQEFRQSKTDQLNKLLQKLREESKSLKKKLDLNDDHHKEYIKTINKCRKEDKKFHQTDPLGLSSLQKTEDDRHSTVRAYVKAQQNTVKNVILSVENAVESNHIHDMIQASSNASHILQTLSIDVNPSHTPTPKYQHNSDTDDEDSMSDVIRNEAIKQTTNHSEQHDIIKRLLNSFIMLAALLNSVVWSYITWYH